MPLTRTLINRSYPLIAPLVFWATRKDPEKAHAYFVAVLEGLRRVGGLSLLQEKMPVPCELFGIANAAGMNKNGEIHPLSLQALGFNRCVIGSVTAEAWAGNPKPRCFRFAHSGSMINRLGLPGLGAAAVGEKIRRFGEHDMPISINLMATPKPDMSLTEQVKDVQTSVRLLRDLPNIDRFELNIACPNTGKDMQSAAAAPDKRQEYQDNLSTLLAALQAELREQQSMSVKVSPDMTPEQQENIVQECIDGGVSEIIACNTTTSRPAGYFDLEGTQRGGASGNALYERAFEVQKRIFFQIPAKKRIIITACGGLDSALKLKACRIYQCRSIQLYTPLIFEGPGLLSRIRQYILESEDNTR